MMMDSDEAEGGYHQMRGDGEVGVCTFSTGVGEWGGDSVERLPMSPHY